MFRVVLALLLLCSQSLPAREQFTVDRLWQLVRATSFEVAPDGQTAAVVVVGHDHDSDSSSSAIWLFDLESRRQPRLLDVTTHNASRPVWHPSGSHLFFLLSRPGQPAQIHRQHIDEDETRPLTSLPVAVHDFRVVEDGRALIFEAGTWPDLGANFPAVAQRLAEQRADKTQARISETRILRHWNRYLTDGMVSRLFRLDIDSGAVSDLMPDFQRVTGFDRFEWDASSDGRFLVYSANSTPAPYRELNFDLYLRDLADGSERNLTPGNLADDVRPVFDPNGRQIAYGRYQRPATGSDLLRLAKIDLETGEHTELTGEMDGPISDWTFRHGSRRLLFTSQSQGRQHLFQWRAGRVQRIARGGTIEHPRAAGRGIAYLRHDMGSPPDLWYMQAGQDPRRITDLNGQRMRALRQGRYDSVDYTSADGTSVQMFVAYPPGWRRGERYPAVLLSHGGPFSSWNDGFGLRWHPGLLAAEGYLVAMPNFRGSIGFGQAFADAILGNHGQLPVADTLAAADWLIENAGADPQRLALAGGSYGGYLTVLLTGLSDRFKAAIVHAGVYDLGQQFASDEHWQRPIAYGAAPWTDPDHLHRWSPSRLVPQMNTPTLILHGEMDYRVPVTQGINLHGALTGKGVPARIVIFPNEHHQIARPQAARLWWTETLAWLRRWNRADAGAQDTPSS